MSTEEETSNEMGDGNIAPSSAYARPCCRQRQIASRKAAVAMMAKLFAIRLAPNDIAVYEVRPGLIHTPMTGVAQSRFDKLLEEGFCSYQPLGHSPRMSVRGTMAAEELPFTTGAAIQVDGGMHIHQY